MKSARLNAERSQRLPNRRTAQHSGEVDPGPLDAERTEVVRNYVIAAQALAGGNRTRASRMPRCAPVRPRAPGGIPGRWHSTHWPVPAGGTPTGACPATPMVDLVFGRWTTRCNGSLSRRSDRGVSRVPHLRGRSRHRRIVCAMVLVTQRCHHAGLAQAGRLRRLRQYHPADRRVFLGLITLLP